MYVPLPKLRDLLTNSQLQEECLEYVATQGLYEASISTLHDVIMTLHLQDLIHQYLRYSICTVNYRQD